jgi:hypothetical protein
MRVIAGCGLRTADWAAGGGRRAALVCQAGIRIPQLFSGSIQAESDER